MCWKARIHRKAMKQLARLPEKIRSAALLLARDLEIHGPMTGGEWKNLGKLKGIGKNKHHCHLNKGKPTYVCCWEVINKEIKLLEVYYVGTHEKAPY